MSKHIDQIFYINLNDRPNRKAFMEEQLQLLDIPFERFPAVDSRKNGVGCTRSHLEIYKLARERGYKTILILEDDFQFDISKIEFECKLTQLFENGPSFNVCFISNTSVEREEPIPNFPFFHRVLDAHGSEGYIVHGEYLNTLIDLYEIAAVKLEKTGQHWIYTMDRAWLPLLVQDQWIRFTHRVGHQNNNFPSDCI
jgi:GR25 family glycosyltransferase involved in LPS biosynthesis